MLSNFAKFENMKRSGYADLPLHGGHVPHWLAQRMSRLGGAITEAIIDEYGKKEFLRQLSDPFWFQSLGCVMGMDWHSSGITTSVMGALKKAANLRSRELGIYLCGGRGKFSRQTPDELLNIAWKTGLNGDHLVRCNKLTAKVDNTAIQDGFQLYLHSFALTDEGDWAVIQQGMNPHNRQARRYHWHSPGILSFVKDPHTSVYGKNQGMILNLTHQLARPTRKGLVELSRERPYQLIPEIKKILMPGHHEVKAKIGYTDKKEALKKLHHMAKTLEKNFAPQPEKFNEYIQKEKKESWKYGGKSVFGKENPSR